MKSNLKIILERIEGKLSLSEKFHNETNNKALLTTIGQFPKEWTNVYFKSYSRLPRVKLDNNLSISGELGSIIRKRRSDREFSEHPISKRELSKILFFSAGLIKIGKSLNESRRPYPSAGARYPLEIYPLIINCRGLDKGLYHYNVKENSLELLKKGDWKKAIKKIAGGDKWIGDSAVIIIISGVLLRTAVKYGDRGYRYMLMETGSLITNICLMATELGLASCPVCGFIDLGLNKFLDIDQQKEFSLCIIPIGRS